MHPSIQSLVNTALDRIEHSATLAALEQVRVDYLGKKGQLTACFKALDQMPAPQKPEFGQRLNEAKQRLLQALQLKKAHLQAKAVNEVIAKETIDVTLPGRGHTQGSLHPITQCQRRIERFFGQLGFTKAQGPEIETDYYNFTALNMPAHHPTRTMHDTFYVADEQLLRTHTSPMQIRMMEKSTPPIRLLVPGRAYRRDWDITHTPMFHQVEGLYVAEEVTFANLKAILQDFLSDFFQQALPCRFRPSYFPFTEPSAEVDIRCVHCQGARCRTCHHTGWLEIAGCGMVHPHVLQMVHIDPERYSGWAFGMGIDRLAMLYYGIDDLRLLFEPDLRFLRQFMWR